MSQPRLDNFFKTKARSAEDAKPQAKRQRAEGGTREEAAASVGAARAAALEQLKRFDLDMKYGPGVGLTREERWRRAAKLGLDPPPAVLALLQRFAADDAEAQQFVWHGVL